MADQIYFTDENGKGDFYQCILPAGPGESPSTNPEKWSRIQIPKQWRLVLSRLTYANLLEADGQTDKAEAQREIAEMAEHTGLEVLIRNEANRDTWRCRPAVQTPGDPLGRSNILYSRSCKP